MSNADEWPRDGVPVWHLVFALFTKGDAAKADGSLEAEERVYLVRAQTCLEAFRRGTQFCLEAVRRSAERAHGSRPSECFHGIWQLTPVWETFDDGAELGSAKCQWEHLGEPEAVLLQESELGSLMHQGSKVRAENEKHPEFFLVSAMFTEGPLGDQPFGSEELIYLVRAVDKLQAYHRGASARRVTSVSAMSMRRGRRQRYAFTACTV